MACVKKEERIDIKQQKYNVKQKLAQIKNKGKVVDLTKKPNAKSIRIDNDIDKQKNKINELIKEIKGKWMKSVEKEMFARWIRVYQTNISTKLNSYRLLGYLQKFYSRISELNERNTPNSENTEIITKIDEIVNEISNYSIDTTKYLSKRKYLSKLLAKYKETKSKNLKSANV